ncbi:MAG TPA: hypothetical protein VFN37_08630 [Candidatus Baltobacteraceae bacterium]|nr:hypothetical protein [Candidatus Baltobacteraceae bacterium]
MLALIAAAAMAAPSPTPAGSQLKTIATVRSTPFCTSIAQHFNAAVSPMLANDRALDQIDPQLVDLNDAFNHPDYQIRYGRVRAKLIQYVNQIQKNLPFIQTEINGLRKGEALTKDPQDAHDIRQIAEKLQLAYDKQMQLATDLTGVIHAMMEYNPPADLDVAAQEMNEAQTPEEMRNVKSYLKFDGQRDVVNQAENAAADSAITLVENRCSVTK